MVVVSMHQSAKFNHHKIYFVPSRGATVSYRTEKSAPMLTSMHVASDVPACKGVIGKRECDRVPHKPDAL